MPLSIPTAVDPSSINALNRPIKTDIPHFFSQTNSSRSKSLELHIPSRVAAELAALQKKQDETLTSLREELSPSSPSSSTKSSSASSDSPSPSSPSSSKVFSDLDKLRQDLSARKKVKDMPRDVEKARDEVVSCLRLNDRKPLDCWREVQAFRDGVARMEKEFIQGVL